MNKTAAFVGQRPLAPVLAAFLAAAAVTSANPAWVQAAAEAASRVMDRGAPASTTAVEPAPFTYKQLDPGNLEVAIGAASELTGVSKAHLMETAMRESSMNPRAEASTSSATGLFQFTDGTWIEMIKRYGDRYGLAAEAALADEGGKIRRHILDLRFDPRVSALMGAELARENARVLEQGLGRPARESELYAAHVLGPANAVKLIDAAYATPTRSAAAMFPKAAAANKAIFYRNGRPRTAIEVLGRLV